MTNEVSVDTDQVERSLRMEVAQEVITKAEEAGWVEINNSGSFLHTRESIQADQSDWDDEDESKNFDFSGAPYWLTGAGEPIAILGVHDDDLLCQFDIGEDDLEAAILVAESEKRREGLTEVLKTSRPHSDLASPDEARARRSRGRSL